MDSHIIILISFLVYLVMVVAITRWTRQGASERSNSAFFLAGRSTPWWIVAIGMIGDSISGVTFVSVPGMVGTQGMTYLQLCIGFFLGYIVVAYVLLPLYYRMGLTSIYTYLDVRYGRTTYRTGAIFFLVSKLFGAAAKLYLISLILQTLVFGSLGIPYTATVAGLVAIIWLYTRQGGMGTIVWTDVLQTIALVTALVLIIWETSARLGLSLSGIFELTHTSSYSRIFVLDDWMSRQHLAKQLLSGAFIVIVMTGLDQNMMQKNLTCRTLPEAQRNMLTYGFCFIPLNYLFLMLGILLIAFADSQGIALPARGDEILPMLASGHLGTVALVCFTLGVTAASFSNADSALTSLTTSVCVDLLGVTSADSERERKLRGWVHLVMCILFVGMVLMIASIQQSSVLNTIYVAVGYTYGPLLGLYAYGMCTKRRVTDRYTPIVCIASPMMSYLVGDALSSLGYTAGYELLLLNGLFTFVGLHLISREEQTSHSGAIHIR